MTEQLHTHIHARTGHISLNRPKALHALTLDMCHAMSAALTEWAANEAVEAVILDHAEGRGFCAGGDINLLRNSALNDDGESGRAFFHDEYRLNHQMFEYKPIVAFMDGITMGAVSASRCRANIGSRPRTRASPCPKAVSACSPTWAADGTCRGWAGAWGNSSR